MRVLGLALFQIVTHLERKQRKGRKKREKVTVERHTTSYEANRMILGHVGRGVLNALLLITWNPTGGRLDRELGVEGRWGQVRGDFTHLLFLLGKLHVFGVGVPNLLHSLRPL